MEFSRVSQSRDGALTLVLDPVHGASIIASWALSRRNDLDSILEDLRLRAGTSRSNIGYVNGQQHQARFPECADVVRSWATAQRLDGVVWTDLPSNFEEKAGRPFSVQAALAHLDSLSEKGKTQASSTFATRPNSSRRLFAQFLQTSDHRFFGFGARALPTPVSNFSALGASSSTATIPLPSFVVSPSYSG